MRWRRRSSLGNLQHEAYAAPRGPALLTVDLSVDAVDSGAGAAQAPAHLQSTAASSTHRTPLCTHHPRQLELLSPLVHEGAAAVALAAVLPLLPARTNLTEQWQFNQLDNTFSVETLIKVLGEFKLRLFRTCS